MQTPAHKADGNANARRKKRIANKAEHLGWRISLRIDGIGIEEKKETDDN